MANTYRNRQDILTKLNIEKLKPMQEEAIEAFSTKKDLVLLSPTGTGKTLAYLLPLIEKLDQKSEEIQALVLVPSRELAIQIETVIRQMGTGFKANAVYGGRAGSKDKIELKHRPAILIGTPGRVADHMRKETFSTESIKTLILDEFDKSLEIGFESDMIEIVDALPSIDKRILTSATQKVAIPAFVGLKPHLLIDYSQDGISQLEIKTVLSEKKDKLQALVDTLSHIGNKPGIIFCNFKDTIDWMSDFLTESNISHACFYGGMEQMDRERALIKFRNGTHQLLLATDLAARGIDIPELGFIIHYQLPPRGKEFIHRNGRTARMNASGTAYIMQWEDEKLPEFIQNADVLKLKKSPLPTASLWRTLFISGGRKDKISKGDIAGLFLKQGGLDNDQLGIIELKQDCAFVAVHKSKVKSLIETLNNSRLKKKKVRISLLK